MDEPGFINMDNLQKDNIEEDIEEENNEPIKCVSYEHFKMKMDFIQNDIDRLMSAKFDIRVEINNIKERQSIHSFFIILPLMVIFLLVIDRIVTANFPCQHCSHTKRLF